MNRYMTGAAALDSRLTLAINSHKAVDVKVDYPKTGVWYQKAISAKKARRLMMNDGIEASPVGSDFYSDNRTNVLVLPNKGAWRPPIHSIYVATTRMFTICSRSKHTGGLHNAARHRTLPPFAARIHPLYSQPCFIGPCMC